MTYMILLHCLHPYLLQLSFCHYSYYVIITQKLGLQSTEEYFPYIAYAFLLFYNVRRSVLFKIHAANIEATKIFV